MTREELRKLLDIHGADPDRWPAERRAAMAALCARDPQAARMLAEARALDALLTEAVPAPLASEAGETTDEAAADLVRRVLAAAMTDETGDRPGTGADGRAGRVIAFPAPSGRTAEDDDSAHIATRHAPPPGGAWRWAAAGMLAASLFVGIWLGGIATLSPVGESLLGPTRLAAADDATLEVVGEIVELASAADDGEELP
ncbi:MAG TPA: hypothetical protein ENK13_05580 [Thermopetrobacter sp.]|nr:hypothetical protein [Thermopetrobacter sp.]